LEQGDIDQPAGTFMMCRAVGKQMVSQAHGGKIVNIASVGGKRPPPPGSGPYGVSKAAVIFLTHVLANELGKYNINLNAGNRS
jgi:NAD(P)-dependent dehydrogenase (short-subunit alcohol dehydrogenase family)